jgi:predicted aspartyl protease
MMGRRLIINKPYTRTGPFLDVKVLILNPHTNQQTSFDQVCLVDTGFSGGLHVPRSREAEIRLIGVEATPTTVSLAGGVPGTGYVCFAYVQRIEDFWFPMPGIETELLIRGEEPALLGRDILKSMIAEFDGPRKLLSIYQPASDRDCAHKV